MVLLLPRQRKLQLFNWFNKRVSNDAKVKAEQAAAQIILVGTLIFYFDLQLFLIGLLLGWCLWIFGGSMCLHKYSSHKTFEPKNKLIKVLMVYAGTMCNLGSTICWASGHRLHHANTDHKDDIHLPTRREGLWHKIKTWFFYFDVYHVDPRKIRDLITDDVHKFFHTHYHKVFLGTVAAVALIDPLYAVYLVLLPGIYTIHCAAYITVASHVPAISKYFWRTFDIDDYTVNSHLLMVLIPGEGYHNTHHAHQGLWNNALRKGEFDISAWFIMLLGNPRHRKLPETMPPIRGKDLEEELQSVSKRIRANDARTA